jgi:hypothetical protein
MPKARPDCRPDFYIAAMGRSGSTLLANWLTRPPNQLVFSEPFFTRSENPRLLRMQLASFGMPATEEEWEVRDETAAERFARMMAPRLEGRRWGFKEVLIDEHMRVLEQFAPAKIVITVRNILDVALSFFEKHRLQGNLNRFGDDWVVSYCVEQSTGILRYRKHLDACGVAHLIVRYEDFVCSDEARDSLQNFVGWTGGGDTTSNFNDFDRSFEVDRHGTSISGLMRERQDRSLSPAEFDLAAVIAERCNEYQVQFGYDELSS